MFLHSVTSSRENMIYTIDCLRDDMWVCEQNTEMNRKKVNTFRFSGI